jgi:hypothetical protein
MYKTPKPFRPKNPPNKNLKGNFEKAKKPLRHITKTLEKKDEGGIFVFQRTHSDMI